MEQIANQLKMLAECLPRFEERLANIEAMLSKPDLTDLLVKSHYSTSEVASLTQDHGAKKAKDWTVRQACNDGRYPEAEKRENGQWLIPKDAVLRILSEGIRPERRK